ncbi:MAG: hypothetical protein J6S29_02260 [Methanosphaera sp.]|nr:hypothetical protein [Methanosphaera sp.]
MTKYDKCTCVKVNRDKMDLIKKKGLNLQDVLDKAMNEELNLNKDETTTESINQINEKINKLKRQKEERMEEYQKKIDSITRTINESKKHEEKLYDNQIEYLTTKKYYLEKTLNDGGQ